MTVAEYIEASGAAPWQWGMVDCTSWVADYVLIQTGRDPFSAYRGRYADESEALALLAGRTLTEAIAADFGLAPTNAPVMGDVGVVDFRGQQIAALCVDGARWALRHETGVAVIRAEPVGAWSIQGGAA